MSPTLQDQGETRTARSVLADFVAIDSSVLPLESPITKIIVPTKSTSKRCMSGMDGASLCFRVVTRNNLGIEPFDILGFASGANNSAPNFGAFITVIMSSKFYLLSEAESSVRQGKPPHWGRGEERKEN